MSLLDGRVALVTGALRGIGAAAAEVLAREGATVIRVARTLKEGSHGRFQDIPCDLTDAEQVDRLVARVLRQHGPPDVVVSNAGAFLLQPLEATQAAELELQLAANIKAPFAVRLSRERSLRRKQVRPPRTARDPAGGVPGNRCPAHRRDSLCRHSSAARAHRLAPSGPDWKRTGHR